ncbi:MAG: hypothetical protein LC742_01905 [Acidobacteria bacterium]|nr:hypothetical protein [Acidobacteriota bacterium]
MTKKNLNAKSQRLRFIIDFEVSLDEPPPAIIFISSDEVIVPQTEAQHYDLTARITINGKQYSVSHFLASPLIGESEVKDWPQAVKDFIAKHAPKQLTNLFVDLSGIASQRASGAPEAMIAHPADIRSRLKRREDRRHKELVPSKVGRPKKGREKAATLAKRKKEETNSKSKLVKIVRSLRDDGESVTKAAIGKKLSPKTKYSTQTADKELAKCGLTLEELLLEA